MESHFLQPKHQKRSNQQHQKLEPTIEELCLHLSSVVSTTEVICLFALNTGLRTESAGKSTLCHLTIIIICQSSLRVFEKSRTHTDSWLCKASLICLKREVQRYFQLFLSLSSRLKVSYNLHIIQCLTMWLYETPNTPPFSCTQHPWQWDCVHHPEDLAVARDMLWHHRWSPCTLLPSDSACTQSHED